MSVRARIGMVQAFDTPGNCRAASISSFRLSEVTPARHSDFGFRLMMVSNISVGAGSVAVCARPDLPNTDCTSGKLLMMRSCICISSAALVTEMPGKVAGIYISVPSSSAGMNSLPNCRAGQIVTTSAARAIVIVKPRAFKTPRMIGR